jgi:hypothetical protein
MQACKNMLLHMVTSCITSSQIQSKSHCDWQSRSQSVLVSNPSGAHDQVLDSVWLLLYHLIRQHMQIGVTENSDTVIVLPLHLKIVNGIVHCWWNFPSQYSDIWILLENPWWRLTISLYAWVFSLGKCSTARWGLTAYSKWNFGY